MFRCHLFIVTRHQKVSPNCHRLGNAQTNNKHLSSSIVSILSISTPLWVIFMSHTLVSLPFSSLPKAFRLKVKRTRIFKKCIWTSYISLYWSSEYTIIRTDSTIVSLWIFRSYESLIKCYYQNCICTLFQIFIVFE